MALSHAIKAGDQITNCRNTTVLTVVECDGCDERFMRPHCVQHDGTVLCVHASMTGVCLRECACVYHVCGWSKLFISHTHSVCTL